MSPKEAIAVAKTYVADLFAAEGARNVGLEELKFDDRRSVWEVTVGFTRDWELSWGQKFTADPDVRSFPRTFKTVEVRDEDGQVLGLKHWPLAA